MNEKVASADGIKIRGIISYTWTKYVKKQR